MENIKYMDERECLGIDCAWCLDTDCELSKTKEKKMIKWYEDDDITIEFDKIPNVDISYPMPWYGKNRNKAICNKPFVNRDDLHVKIRWFHHVFEFNIRSGYEWDGASIPKVFWRIIGSKFNPEFLIASMLHDVLCENHYYINNNRYLSTIVLERCLKVGGVGPVRRWVMKHSVDNWQKFCGWNKVQNEPPRY